MAPPRHTAPASFLGLRAYRHYYLAFVLFAFQYTCVKAISIEYATKFSITCDDEKCTLMQKCVEPAISYTLYKKAPSQGTSMYSNHPTFGQYRSGFVVPVTSLVSLGVTYLPAMDKLDVEDKLVGMLDIKHVSTPSIKQRIAGGFVKEVGYVIDSYYAANSTLVNMLQPNVTFGSKYDAWSMSEFDSFILNCETDENTPLGQVEWVKWFGVLVGLEDKANSEFEFQKSQYFKYVNIARKAKKRPEVVAGFSFDMYGVSTFSIPGGNSYVANLIKDAYGTYVGDNTTNTGSFLVPLDTFIQKAMKAKYWIDADYMNVKYMDDLLHIQPEVELIASVQCQYVVLRDNNRYDDGYIPFFESGTSNPYLVLQDLIHTLHPNVLPAHFQPTFYRRAMFHPQSLYKRHCPYPDSDGSNDDNLPAGAIAGIAIACTFAVVIGMFAAYYFGHQKGEYQALQKAPSASKDGKELSTFTQDRA